RKCESKMKTSTFIAGITVLLLVTSASAQSSLPRGFITGNQVCTYGNSGALWCVTESPARIRHLNCIRANPAGNGCATARTAKRSHQRKRPSYPVSLRCFWEQGQRRRKEGQLLRKREQCHGTVGEAVGRSVAIGGHPRSIPATSGKPSVCIGRTRSE